MIVLTFTVNDPYQHGHYLQECWFSGKPDVSYIASYIKHFGLTSLKENWEIRELAQRLYDGDVVKMLGGKYYHLWEKEPVGVLSVIWLAHLKP